MGSVGEWVFGENQQMRHRITGGWRNLHSEDLHKFIGHYLHQIII